MPVTVERFVDTDVAGGTGDGSSWANAFASLDAWLAAETQRDLVALDRKLTVNYRSTPATARQGVLNFGTGWVTDATREVEIFVPPANRHTMSRGTGTYLRMIDNGSGFPFTNQPAAITYNGLALWVTGTNRDGFSLFAATMRAVNCACFLQSGSTSTSAFFLSGGTAVNCVGVTEGPSPAFRRSSGTGTTINCVGKSTASNAFDAAGMVMTSCYGFSDTGSGFGPFGTKANCFSPDGNNDAAVMSLVDAAFVNTALGAEDFRLTAPSLLIGAGQDNSGDGAWIGPAEDAFGTVRPQGAAWDVGAHEWFEPGVTSGTIHAASHVTGSVANPQNALGAPDGVFTTNGNTNTSWTSRWRLTAIPDAEPVGSQGIVLRVRKGSNTGNPSVSNVTLWEGGVQVATLSGGATTVSSATGVDLSYSFDGAILAGLVDVDIQVATTGVGGSGSNRNSVEIDAITANVQYVMPAQSADLILEGIEAATEAGPLSLGQAHGLTLGGIEAATEAGTLSVGQAHGLSLDGLEGSTEAGALDLGQAHGLLPAGVEAAAEAAPLTIGQAHSLSLGGIEAATEAGTLSLGVDGTASLALVGVEAATEAGPLSLGQAHGLTLGGIDAATEAGTLSLGQVHALALAGIEATTEAGAAQIGQVHGLSLDGAEGVAEAGELPFGQEHRLLPEGVISFAEAGALILGQQHRLTLEGVEAATEAGAMSLGGGAAADPDINAVLTLWWRDDPVVPLAWQEPAIGLDWTEPVLPLEWEEVA